MAVKTIDLVQGSGPMAFAGKAVLVHYTGWLFDRTAEDNKGRRFDSSHDRGEPYGFTLGSGQVIAGWNRGIAGMRVGGQRRLIIPPEFAYGAQGRDGVIPPNATLIFEVELLAAR